ncbi:hypothetical protein N7520_008494 [Penicillium odoratum]|uniref:uncharacterized protein n=1 Tax=Penicillium odoratum TaxID=1167516 RepID=UPI0025475279|nr:uncharacterized protein N7520_008494 [Penicillium odoratum]KAJ5751577.1 hypothetical protein N7520_008494 [Penicillium odoratum]
MRSIRLMLVPGLLFAALVNLVEADRQTLSNLFRYTVETDDFGGCATIGEDTLNSIADDAYTLATQGSKAMSDYQDTVANTHEAAKRLVDVMFLKPSDSEFETVKGRADGVKTWLESGGNVNNGQNKKKPYLFCGDSWVIRQDMSSQMKDKDGTDMVDGDGAIIRIKDSSKMVKARKKIAKDWNVKESKIYPYWSAGIGAYIFNVKYSDDPTKNGCDEADALGYTMNQGSISLIVLCPKSFTEVKLHETSVSAFASSYNEKFGQAPDDNTRIRDVMPAGRTLYHELFHLYWGEDLHPSGKEEYVFRRMTGNAARRDGTYFVKSQAMSNPENYAMQAVAYDYTLSVTAGAKDYPVEFYTGYATYED